MPPRLGYFCFRALCVLAICGCFAWAMPRVGASPARLKYSPGAEVDTALTTTADLSGQVIAAPGGRPYRNVEITLLCIPSGATLRTHTDAKGRFTFHGIVTGIDYVITPWKPGYVFSPGALVVTPTEASLGYDFTGSVEPGFFVSPPAR